MPLLEQPFILRNIDLDYSSNYTSLSIILLNRRNVDIFPYCKKSANIYLHKSNIPNLKLGILDLCSENIPNLEIRNIGFM